MCKIKNVITVGSLLIIKNNLLIGNIQYENDIQGLKTSLKNTVIFLKLPKNNLKINFEQLGVIFSMNKK